MANVDQVRDTAHTESASSNKAGAKPDDTKRVTKPSPLSQPVTQDPTPENTTTAKPESKDKRLPTDSIATQRLAEITNNDFKRPGKSRLRRAFSFGSASELLKASAQSSASKKEAIAAEQARRELLKQELGPEQAAIAEQQEASGLGESIYSHHQGRFFNSSTDNLSVSSTASSASIMLRKMGKGMKRSTRSLVGLFRPKSVMSTASNDGVIVEPMAPQLSVVNVEAERKNVAVNPDPQDVPRGGTVFPKVEPKSRSPSATEDSAADNSQTRKSIVGGDRERAEVLAAVRKGILKSGFLFHALYRGGLSLTNIYDQKPPKQQIPHRISRLSVLWPRTGAIHLIPVSPVLLRTKHGRRTDVLTQSGSLVWMISYQKGGSLIPRELPLHQRLLKVSSSVPASSSMIHGRAASMIVVGTSPPATD